MEATMQNYTGHGWEGKNYNRDLGITEISKIIKGKLKKEYPACKFSIQIQRYTGGQALHISLMEAPFEAIICDQITEFKNGRMGTERVFIEKPNTSGHTQLNHYTFKETEAKGINNGTKLTSKAWTCMKRVSELATSFNFDDSDGMIDYFSTNFYLHLNIGKWDKPFMVTIPSDKAKAMQTITHCTSNSVLDRILA